MGRAAGRPDQQLEGRGEELIGDWDRGDSFVREYLKNPLKKRVKEENFELMGPILSSLAEDR